MTTPNRACLWYAYRCRKCGRGQQRGSAAKWCKLLFPGTPCPCRGLLEQVSRVARPLLRLDPEERSIP